MLYSCCIFNRMGECIFYREWNTSDKYKKNSESKHQSQMKLMYGFLFSMKRFVEGISPKPESQFQSFKTNNYKLHFFESPTGVKFILLTDPNVGSIQNTLQEIYSKLYVELVVFNPVEKTQEGITNTLFVKHLDKHLSQLPWFN
ncbi:hypothetical protein FDP41_000136 [Naegleria fowleri]|uniref:Trafficking protein particle complex subunit n=1 Tax=Naegleria fowleri TaxID=5763 RepID=A0A6A5C724_NAEFO|nr:uncharacterized protein FDP41_000136 [Naegleria fowleri]KAF0985097.1 hypothetical protein FDP41_000136 [Naegleria fowleri]